MKSILTSIIITYIELVISKIQVEKHHHFYLAYIENINEYFNLNLIQRLT